MKVQDAQQVKQLPTDRTRDLGKLGLALFFLVGVVVFTATQFSTVQQVHLLVFAAVIGAYMAMNIGANDVANNVGPAVGSFAITLTTAVVIAAVFEAAGAIIAGGEVVNTIKNGIIDPADVADPNIFIWVMMGALLGGAVWLNLATWLGAPVSTTHSIVGGVMGAAISATGWAVVNWPVMGAIVSSWIISPLAGALIAAGLLYLLEHKVLWKADPLAAAERFVPWLLALMAWTFTTYLALKGFANVVTVPVPVAMGAGIVVGAATYVFTKPRIARRAPSLTSDRDGVNQLFTMPLIFAAALLSFAHGANDVANAIGPLAGIYEVLAGGNGAVDEVGIPLWILVVGALGLAVGLALFGPRLIRTVGSEITELDRSRAFCVGLAAALTVVAASQLGLPVSSTHVALGGIFGVGFLREWLQQRMSQAIEKVLNGHQGDEHFAEVEKMLHEFQAASPDGKQEMLADLKAMGKDAVITAAQQKKLKKALKRQLVKRSQMLRIVWAWIITVPASAGLAALSFVVLRGTLG